MAELYPTQNIDKSVIDTLTRLISPNAADPSTAANNLGPATISQVGNAGKTTADVVGPYQQGVVKALKELGQQHVQEAHAAGMSPEEIQNHPIMNQGQDDPSKILINLLSTIQSQNGPQNLSSPQSSATTPIQQQAMTAIQPSTGPLGKFFDMIGATNAVRGSQLDNLSKAQNIMGQTPEQQVYKAQTTELNQKIAGAEPIQPKDIATLNRETYSASIQAANDAWQRNTEEIKAMQDQFKNLTDVRGPLQKFGGQTSEQKKLQKLIIAKIQQNQQHLTNIQTLIQNPPKAVNENPSSVNNSPFQIGQQYNGEIIKNVRRIK